LRQSAALHLFVRQMQRSRSRVRPLLALTHFGSLPEWPRQIAGSQRSTSLTTFVLLRSFRAPGAAPAIPDSEQRPQCWIKRPAEVTGQAPTCRRPPLPPPALLMPAAPSPWHRSNSTRDSHI